MSEENNWYSEDISQIKSVSFGVFTNNKVKKYSAVKSDPFGINLHESYDNYEPKKGGLVDLRMGSSDFHLNCTTCGQNYIKCPGHFGHTVLTEPVFHYGYLDHLRSLLQCVCIKCSKLLIEDTDDTLNLFSNIKNQIRFKEIKVLAKKTKYCYYCGTPVPKIRKEIKESSASIKIIVERQVGANIVNEETGEMTESKKTLKDILTPRECYNIFRNISDNDVRLLGFDPSISRPEDLIIFNFPIPPVSVRPTAKIDFMSSSTMEDSLTLKIADIIKNNNRLRKLQNKKNTGNDLSTYSQDSHTLLQYHVATYYDNDKISLPKSEFKTGGKPTKSISDRLKSKTGRVRANLMGKRVDYSARSVITSDPYIDIDQVGVPIKQARNLTVPVEVTPHNIEYLTKLVKNGRDVYPGANRLKRNVYINGKNVYRKIDLRYRKQALKLNYGDIVERHIVDDDMVLFNRQPTLHKPSMMGHRVQVLDREDLHTFRMNVSVTKPYNADFDGDEMNFFLPQSVQAANELKYIANSKLQILNATDSSPIIGCIQDPISGGYLLSKTKYKFTSEEARMLLAYTSVEDLSKIKKGNKYSGHEIFSMIIPKGINIVRKKNGEINYQIKNGEFLKGILDKGSLGPKKNSIIHYIWDKYGPGKTQKFIDDAQRLILNYLMFKGLTVGFQDTLLSEENQEEVHQIVNNKILELKLKMTEMENDIVKFNSDLFESIMLGELSTISSSIEKIMSNNITDENGLFVMIKSKAKGSLYNMQQMVGVLGQNNVEGFRVQKKVQGRTIPHFHYQDDTPEARGFVASSFLTGLKNYEFFFHTMAGRIGLIDTAIKTATTGYVQRRLIKALEDIRVCYDGTVRTASGTILQFLYGDNGVNQSVQSEIKLDILNKNNKKIEEEYMFNSTELKKLKKFKNAKKLSTELVKELIEYRDYLRKVSLNSTLNYKLLEEKFKIPVNIQRIIQENYSESNKFDLDPQYIIDRINNFLKHDSTEMLAINKKSKSYNYMIQDEDKFKTLLKIVLKVFFSPKKCIFKYNFSKENFDNVMKDINSGFIKALVEPGEMVGVIAAQSIGEGTTQLTLDTKHFAGSKSSANMGLGRIQELINYSKNIKTPMMTIYLDNETNNSQTLTNSIKNNFKFLSIGELIRSAEIIYFLNDNSSYSKKINDDNVGNPFYVNMKNKNDYKNFNWIFRIELDREKLLDKNTTIMDIKTKFIKYWKKNFTNFRIMKKNYKDIFSKVINCAILSNFDISDVPVLHIRFSMSSFSYSILTEFLKIILNDIRLKGIENIDDVTLLNERVITFDDKTGDVKLGKENIILTNGINIYDFKYMKGIDHTRSIINDTYLTYKLYGIETARTVLYKELSDTYAANGLSINYNHLTVLVDLMTHTGDITSIDRHGIGKLDVDPMTQASFERTMDHFIDASLFNKKDRMRSVSSRIMVGRVIPGGTGYFDILLDTDLLHNTEYGDEETGGRITFNQLEENTLFSDIINYGYNNLDFFIPT